MTAEISGGSERARFYTNINLYNTGSLVKLGNAKMTVQLVLVYVVTLMSI